MVDCSEHQVIDFVVVGGGVAGVSCCQQLAELDPGASITLVSGKDIVKLVTSHRKVTRILEEVVVEERPSFSISENYPNIKVLNDFVQEIDHHNRILKTSMGLLLRYKKVCLCLGAKPSLIKFQSEYILGIRDVDSVAMLQQKLANAERVIVVGNGGIALELVYELTGCEVIWAIKNEVIGNVYFDKAVASFLLPNLNEDLAASNHPRKSETVIFKRKKYAVERENSEKIGESDESLHGGALGPDWSVNATLRGKGFQSKTRKVHIEYNCEVKNVMNFEQFNRRSIECSELPDEFATKRTWPVYAELTTGKIYGADLIVSATGVSPNTELNFVDAKIELANDGGIKVDDNMGTNLPHVYAAGDSCTACWTHSPHWFQMRLWTQAYQMGIFAARCMIKNIALEEASLDFCFELFAHVTSFFGHKLCLLGRFNAQGLENDYELLVRYTPGIEYVKVVLQNGKLRGALLLGETDLEETFENLILNEMDLSTFGESLLDPDIDIDDYFD